MIWCWLICITFYLESEVRKQNFETQRVRHLTASCSCLRPPRSKTTWCRKKLKLNGFTCVSKDPEEVDKNLAERGNEIVFFDRLHEVISYFHHVAGLYFYIAFSLSMNGHPHSAPPVSQRCVCVCVWAAVWGSLVTMAYHVSGTVQGFIKPQSWEIWTNQICVNMPLSLSVYSDFFESPFSFFYSNPISFPIIILQKELRSTRESLAGWTAAQKHLGARLCKLYMQTPVLLAARIGIGPRMQLLSRGSIYLCLASGVAFQWLPAL